MEEVVVSPAPVDVLLGRYREYLVEERGLRPCSVSTYVWNAGQFMRLACGDDPDRIGSLTAADVARFVIRYGEGRRASTVNTAVVSARVLLRYFYAMGLIARPLAQAEPWLARGRMSTLPRMVVPGAVERLLASFDPSTLAGVRDRTMVIVFARLGLRVGELVEMRVDDIDWRRGELLVRSKGGWRDPLPIPVDVGDELAAYLRVRGRNKDWREVFLRVVPPGGPLTPTAVRAAIRRGCDRVGLPDLCTHRLRHSVAGDLLREGASLVEIGQVLRHHDLATTAVYAKVDQGTLATVAGAWPGSAA